MPEGQPKTKEITDAERELERVVKRHEKNIEDLKAKEVAIQKKKDGIKFEDEKI